MELRAKEAKEDELASAPDFAAFAPFASFARTPEARHEAKPSSSTVGMRLVRRLDSGDRMRHCSVCESPFSF